MCIRDSWDAYNDRLKKLMGYDNKMLREFTEMARKEPKRVVFAEANHANMLQAASTAMKEGICKPILLGNDELIGKLAESIGCLLYTSQSHLYRADRLCHTHFQHHFISRVRRT